MKFSQRSLLVVSLIVLWTCAAAVDAFAQDEPHILTPVELGRVVPPGFYFQGQSAPTQMRNTAAARFGAKQYVIAGMVDTSGYSTEVRAKYEGFLINDAPMIVGTGILPIGAYGFGFTETGQFNIFDVGGNAVMTVQTSNDTALPRPRPLMMSLEKGGVRLYSGRRYVLITTSPKEAEL